MKRILIIPNINDMEETLKIAKKYNLGYEYNDFFNPNVLDDKKQLDELVSKYKEMELPDYCTMHGAFFDVIPFSLDKKIKEISLMRIEESVEVARRLGVKAVVFHTNYNPFLNADAYISQWLEENIRVWGQILEENQDINIYIENMFDANPDIMEKLSEGLCKYENYGVCLDYAHASLTKIPLEEWCRKLGKYIKHIHINDNDLVSDLHLAWGDGKINRQEFYTHYKKYMNNATVLVETALEENKIKSLQLLEKEGFLD
ncbi:MAG: sugar phosphate isomerase/epimerase [Lachnospiraceae bacterium]|nr:sugar phosphate isomerase/epimerase [Lachnospiraceae bacterium]